MEAKIALRKLAKFLGGWASPRPTPSPHPNPFFVRVIEREVSGLFSTWVPSRHPVGLGQK